MRQRRTLYAIGALLGVLAYLLTGCGGGDGTSASNNWNDMLWNSGVWQ